MEKTYAPHSIEQRWYQTWKKKAILQPNLKVNLIAL